MLPVINMTPEQREEFRRQEAAYKADRFANPRDASRANGDAETDAAQMSAYDSINMFTHTPITSLDMIHEMYRFAEVFGIDNKIKV